MVMMKNGLLSSEGHMPEELMEVLRLLSSGKGEAIGDQSIAVEVVQLAGGFTNRVFRLNLKTSSKTRTVLVRVFGVANLFDRNDEMRTFELMSEHGQGPRLLGQFPGGRVEEFIHARTLRVHDLRNPKISALVAAKVREFHNLKMHGPKRVFLWDRLRKWLTEAKRLSSPRVKEAFCLDSLEEEIGMLERELSKGKNQAIGFCHNDLQCGNIMLDEDTNSITIIDYEYASYNPVAYDIANYFCELTLDYHSDTPHVVDYNKYPNLEERQRFVFMYLSAGGNKPSEDEVAELVDDVEKYTLPNHLQWGLWAVISEHVSNIEFDNFEFARQRFHRYSLRKPMLIDVPNIVDASVAHVN